MEDIINTPYEKEIISQILNVENNSTWQIIDKVDDLRLVYYSQKKNWIRGQIIDIVTKELICDVYGESKSPIIEVVADSIPTDYKLTDTELNKYQLDSTSCIFERGIEATIFRVFRYKNNTYYATHKKIDASKSRWVNTPTFLEMYKSMNGPEINFSGKEVYYFLLAHQSVQQASNNFRTSKLHFLEARNIDNSSPMADDLRLLYPIEERLNLNEANKHLRPKNHQEWRAEGGDFLILRARDLIRNQNFIFKVISRSYNWRLSVINNNPNMNHLWYYHSTAAIVKSKYSLSQKDFEKRFLIPDPIPNVKQLMEMDLTKLSFADFKYLNNRELDQRARYLVILFNLIFCSPVFRRAEILEIYLSYCQDKVRLANKILSDYDNQLQYKEEESSFDRILKQSINYANQRNSLDRDNIYNNIRRLIDSEVGTSLYRMIKHCYDQAEEEENKEISSTLC